MSTALETGTGEGYLARVNSDGSLATAAKPSECGIVKTFTTVQTTSGTLVPVRTGRRGLWVQNQGANPVHLNFAAAAATNQDWIVAAGAEFRSDDFSYEGEIRAIAVGGTSNVLVLEKA